MEKKKGFILYFDILGYRNILKNNTDKENERIANILEQFSNFIQNQILHLNMALTLKKKNFFLEHFLIISYFFMN